MKKVIVVGCSGAGKSVFSRKLADATGLPLYHLDMIWHRADRTTISREEFDRQLKELLEQEKWILDGNFRRTFPERLAECETVFLFDLPVEECIAGVESRIGHKRVDMPWVEEEFDPDFLQWIKEFPEKVLPYMKRQLENCGKQVIIFHSRPEADRFIDGLSREIAEKKCLKA